MVSVLFFLVLFVEKNDKPETFTSIDLCLAGGVTILALYFLYKIRRAERWLAPILFLMDGLFIAMAVALSGGSVSYYLPLFLVSLSGAILSCTPRVILTVAAEHFILMWVSIGSVEMGFWRAWTPVPDPDDLGAFVASATAAMRWHIFLEQGARWSVFLVLLILVCGILARQVWVREEGLRVRERNLEQKRRLIQLGELTGRIAHGVNTPLGLVSGNLEMLLGETRKGTKLHKRLVELDGFVQRAIQTVRQTLDYSRQTMSQIRPVVLPELLAAVVEASQVKLTKSGGQLILDIPPGIPKVNGYPESLFQAFLNVVENALDSIQAGGVVTVNVAFQFHSLRLSAADRRGDVRVTVRDTGRGIPPGEMDRIFEPFYSTKDFGHGTGLGLAIVKRVMEEHQGQVSVESKLGLGTAVTLSLPAEAPPAEITEPPRGL